MNAQRLIIIALTVAAVIGGWLQPAVGDDGTPRAEAPETSLKEAVAAVSPLDAGALVEWAYQQVKARGMLVYTASLRGDSAPGASLLLATWRPGGVGVVSLAAGGDFGRDGASERPVALDTIAWHVAAPVHLSSLAGRLLDGERTRRNFNWLPLPDGLDPFLGPALVWPPWLPLNKLRVDRDLRFYLSVGKKFG